MTLTFEPMINSGQYPTRLLPDGWTVVTRDHSLSAQWEHTIAVTDPGVRGAYACSGGKYLNTSRASEWPISIAELSGSTGRATRARSPYSKNGSATTERTAYVGRFAPNRHQPALLG
ncbi:MAG: hypothetical protein CM1200mP41_33600 [Gammaproteobacteria bacterium]|nr:MAG: hypothetical protein CM1200mP41_33600 [Gammaproteobacteria bacterium]